MTKADSDPGTAGPRASRRALTAAMRTQRVKRLMSVTGFGAGDCRDGIGPLRRLPFLALFGRALVGKAPVLAN